MAKKYDWGDGNGAIHSITLEAHIADTHGSGAAGVLSALAPPPPKGLVPPKGLPGPPLGSAANPVAPAPVTGAPAPAANGAPNHGGPAEIVPDAQFLAEAAKRAFDVNTGVTNLTEEGKNDRADTAEAVRRMLADAVQGRQTINEGANKEGLFYSGQREKRQNDYDTQVNRASSDAQTQLQEREDARTRAITALQQGAPLEDAIGLAANRDRQIGRDTTAADAGALVAPTVSPTPVAPAPIVKPVPGTTAGAVKTNTKTKETFTEQKAPGGVWHIYNGRKVWVPSSR